MGALSRLDHVAALGYAASMAHDAAALHLIVRRTRSTLSMEFQCLGGKERARWWLLPGGAAAVCLGLIGWRWFSGRRASEKKHLY